MSNPTTVRLSPEQREQLKKMAILCKTQTRAISRAIALLWEQVGETAEKVWAIAEAQAEGADAIARRLKGDG